MTHADLKVGVPEGATTRSPDFLVENGNSRHGIEVKRPASESGAKRLLKSGAAQLRAFGVYGGVVLDLTDSLDIPDGYQIVDSASAPGYEVMRGPFMKVTKALERIVFDANALRLRPGFPRKGMMLSTYAREWRFQRMQNAGVTIDEWIEES